ncbi:LysR family transcriptional regulator [Noviherbaspirillum pedocola]|uniref:LysR family transcriptional regulator n=1 Tax=Noviherbaspirillum pedocola TaxID=2801341 RepID=A0A934SZD9_9BURK|nr:LysR family transcriptional regulator [Noviherbaspirillum pedocola]MBK4738517.1 LysR family transcriptional regulator [Noviherbaspirillum pedocola]
MPRSDFDNLHAFMFVARERSFTRAAAQLGVTQSALSHTMRTLEAKLGVRLLTRTTRGVSPTEAGERLFTSLESHFEGIEASLSALNELREKPAGTIRITTHDHAADTVLWPRLKKVLFDYPEVKVEININYGLVDIVEQRFDAGVRFGDQVARDMIALRISPDVRMAVVASPAYFTSRPIPKVPQELTGHNCVNMRLPTYNSFYAWEFVKGDQELQVQVDGQCSFNTTPQILQAALDGYGVAYVPEDLIIDHVAAGRLQRVLDDWCPTFPGYHLYYPSRRQSSPAFALILDTLRV